MTTRFKLLIWGALAAAGGIGGGALALRSPAATNGWHGVVVEGSAGSGTLRWIDGERHPYRRLVTEAARLDEEGYRIQTVPRDGGGGWLLGRAADRWVRGMACPPGSWGGERGWVVLQEGRSGPPARRGAVVEGLGLPANAEVLLALRIGEGRVVQCRVESQDRIDPTELDAGLAAVGWCFDEELSKEYRVYHRGGHSLVVHGAAHNLLFVEHAAP